MDKLQQLINLKSQRQAILQQEIHNLIDPIVEKYQSGMLEIGCGHGHFLSAYAQNYPDKLCIGVDIINKRLERCNRKKNLASIENLFFFKSEATEFIEIFTKQHTINEIFILFPDPWPKNKHRKNRLLQVSFLNDLFQKAVSVIYLRSDSYDYISWVKLQINKVNEQWHCTEIDNLPFEHETFFQQIHPQFYTLKITNNKYKMSIKY